VRTATARTTTLTILRMIGPSFFGFERFANVLRAGGISGAAAHFTAYPLPSRQTA